MSDDTKSEAMRGLSAWLAVIAAKIVGAAHMIGVNTWGEAASAAAFGYTALLAVGWLVRYVGKPTWMWIRRGHERRRKARRTRP